LTEAKAYRRRIDALRRCRRLQGDAVGRRDQVHYRQERLTMTDLGQDPGAILGVWAAKTAGGCAGAGVSLIYLLPKSRREAASRFATGLTCGLIFGGPTGLWLTQRLGISGTLSGPETMLAGSAAASLCAWWVLGALSRVAERYGGRR
jgi:hypothetical protein